MCGRFAQTVCVIAQVLNRLNLQQNGTVLRPSTVDNCQVSIINAMPLSPWVCLLSCKTAWSTARYVGPSLERMNRQV